MKREIKFRAYTSEGMVTPYAWVNESNMLGQRMSPSPIKPLMQFTGLRDANGVDIYEGDIVECDEHFYYEIFWSEKYHSWHASECGGLADLPTEIKVIGNIYEHPHLPDGNK